RATDGVVETPLAEVAKDKNGDVIPADTGAGLGRGGGTQARDSEKRRDADLRKQLAKQQAQNAPPPDTDELPVSAPIFTFQNQEFAKALECICCGDRADHSGDARTFNCAFNCTAVVCGTCAEQLVRPECPCCKTETRGGMRGLPKLPGVMLRMIESTPVCCFYGSWDYTDTQQQASTDPTTAPDQGPVLDAIDAEKLGPKYCAWKGTDMQWAGHVKGVHTCDHAKDGPWYVAKCTGCTEKLRPLALEYHQTV
ncbi:hypothetical protein T484DRAFT_1845234, partial [Baffinella frigidus]